jgi:hypothetical protein
MDLHWRTIGQALMRVFIVVETEVVFQACFECRDDGIVETCPRSLDQLLDEDFCPEE